MGKFKVLHYQVFLIFVILVILLMGIAGIKSNNKAMEYINKVGVVYSPQIDACMEVKYNISEAHLWFEEVISGHESIDTYVDTLKSIEEVEFYLNALHRGGSNLHGSFLPLQNIKAIKELELVESNFKIFKSMLIKRYRNITLSEYIDENLDESTDYAFDQVILHIDVVENILQDEMRETIAMSNTTFDLSSWILKIVVTIVLITVMGLLIRMKYVQNSNPLTNMPGNKEIDSILKKHIKKKYDSTVVYVDLDNFKAYNDLYGFSRGDSLIKMTGDILRDVIIKVHNSKAFAGHIGGDDFVIFLPENNLEEYLDLIIEKFSSSIVSCYRKEDIDKGYCLSKDRAGKEKKYSLVTISLAAVKLSSVRGKSYMEIIDICTDLKRKAKSKEGNNYEIYLP